ncbi:MAG TPA: MarR family transcriptional regulator [Rhizomicrobium sp.]|jgi:DNA-binding MarR family transcriptional regulator|nr:MarR family transcriptional regulator [Rhizomicrobium sp.]
MSAKRGATTRALSDTDFQRLAQFRYALRQFLHFSEEAARGAGLNPQQYQALVVVRGFDGGRAPTVGELAKRLLIEHHSAVGLVDRLESAGLFMREKGSSDGRRVSLVLTDRAQNLLSDLVVAHRSELRRLMPLMKPLFNQLNPAKPTRSRAGK